LLFVLRSDAFSLRLMCSWYWKTKKPQSSVTITTAGNIVLRPDGVKDDPWSAIMMRVCRKSIRSAGRTPAPSKSKTWKQAQEKAGPALHNKSSEPETLRYHCTDMGRRFELSLPYRGLVIELSKPKILRARCLAPR
jgi:hypothetical protein